MTMMTATINDESEIARALFLRNLPLRLIFLLNFKELFSIFTFFASLFGSFVGRNLSVRLVILELA